MGDRRISVPEFALNLRQPDAFLKRLIPPSLAEGVRRIAPVQSDLVTSLLDDSADLLPTG